MSGYGYGTASDGSPVSFTYGLSPEESAPYLAAPARSARRSSSGTGFFVSARGHVLTNEHVVDGCATIRARTADGAKVLARVVAADGQNDLAVVAVPASAPAFVKFGGGPAYRPGDRVVTYGFPLSGTLSSSGNLTTGTLTALAGLGNDSRYLQFSAPVQPGNSGGPLADARGVVIGVVAAKLDSIRMAEATGDVPQNVNFAIKDVVAKTFLQAHGIPYSEQNGLSALSAADVGDALRRAVVYIECQSR